MYEEHEMGILFFCREDAYVTAWESDGEEGEDEFSIRPGYLDKQGDDMYTEHEMEVIPYEENIFVVASIVDEEKGPGWSYDSLKPNRSDS